MRSLARLHLSAFDPKSIIVSTSCLEEVNRLRRAFRNDLPLYQMPPKAKPNRKRKLIGNNTISPAKKMKLAGTKPNIKSLSQTLHTSPKKCKRSQPLKCDNETPTKKPRTYTNEHGHRPMQSRRTFNPVHEQWQRTACNLTGLQFVSRCDLHGGGPNVPLTRPRRVRHILGDGNCLFRSLSYIITGTEAQHLQVREALLNHLARIEDMMIGHHIGEYSSIVEYIRGTNMDRNGMWGTDIELITASHMLSTSLSMYGTWTPQC